MLIVLWWMLKANDSSAVHALLFALSYPCKFRWGTLVHAEPQQQGVTYSGNHAKAPLNLW